MRTIERILVLLLVSVMFLIANFEPPTLWIKKLGALSSNRSSAITIYTHGPSLQPVENTVEWYKSRRRQSRLERYALTHSMVLLNGKSIVESRDLRNISPRSDWVLILAAHATVMNTSYNFEDTIRVNESVVFIVSALCGNPDNSVILMRNIKPALDMWVTIQRIGKSDALFGDELIGRVLVVEQRMLNVYNPRIDASRMQCRGEK